MDYGGRLGRRGIDGTGTNAATVTATQTNGKSVEGDESGASAESSENSANSANGRGMVLTEISLVPSYYLDARFQIFLVPDGMSVQFCTFAPFVARHECGS